MIKKRNFWIGIVAGFLIGFLYGWLAIWATYTALERAHIQREAELRAIKEIIYFSEDILRQREEAFEWNLQSVKPAPERATEPEGDDNE